MYSKEILELSINSLHLIKILFETKKSLTVINFYLKSVNISLWVKQFVFFSPCFFYKRMIKKREMNMIDH